MKVLVRFGFLNTENLTTSWSDIECVSLEFSGDSIESKIVSYLESEIGNYFDNPLGVADIQRTPIGGYFIPLYESSGGLFESVEIVLLDSLAEGQVFFGKGEKGDD